MKKIPILIVLILITLNTQAQEEIYDCTFFKYTKSINGVIDEKESKDMTEMYQAFDKRIRMEKKGKNINTKSYTADDINDFNELNWKIDEVDSQVWVTKREDLVSLLGDRDEVKSYLAFLFENNVLLAVYKSEKVDIEGKKTVEEENMFYSCRQRDNNVFQSSHKEKFDYDEAAQEAPRKEAAKRASIMFKCNIDGVINTITFSKNTIYIDNGRYEAVGSHLSFNKPNVFELGHGAGSVKFENRKITFIPDTDDPSETYRCQKIRK